MAVTEKTAEQALVLLLAVLDMGKLMLLMREGCVLDGDAHRLGTAAARDEINQELVSWGPPRGSCSGEPTMHAPLLLAWATFLCLSNSLAPPAGEELSETMSPGYGHRRVWLHSFGVEHDLLLVGGRSFVFICSEVVSCRYHLGAPSISESACHAT